MRAKEVSLRVDQALLQDACAAHVTPGDAEVPLLAQLSRRERDVLLAGGLLAHLRRTASPSASPSSAPA